MVANPLGKQYALYIWKDVRGEGEPDWEEYFDTEMDLRTRAEKLIGGGTFGYLWAGQLNVSIDDYDPLDEWIASN